MIPTFNIQQKAKGKTQKAKGEEQKGKGKLQIFKSNLQPAICSSPFAFYLLPFVLCLLPFASFISAQQFYNYEDFFTDATYVKKHKLKSVSITIPAMRSDTMSEIITYQKLCYNMLGKFSWIEHDKMDRKGLKKYFLWHFYDDSARLTHTKLIEKCANQDSLREEEKIRYDDNGKILREEFAQFYVGNYNDWKIDYAWQGDTIKIRYFENDKKDTTLYDAQSGKIISFEQNSWKYKLQYDDKNRIVKSSYYWLNAPFTNDNKIDERTYRYDRYNSLERIESDAWAVIFNNDFEGLPYSSHVIDKNTGKQIGWRVEYAYEFR